MLSEHGTFPSFLAADRLYVCDFLTKMFTGTGLIKSAAGNDSVMALPLSFCSLLKVRSALLLAGL